jgi:YidC/Oxa1 family membrane protein insertase
MDTGLVASVGAATILGVPLAGRGYLGAGVTYLAVVAALAGTAALLSYVTQRYVAAPNTVLEGVPDTLASRCAGRGRIVLRPAPSRAAWSSARHPRR